MGGPGSGRWKYYEPKLCVEDCWMLDARALREEGILKLPEPGYVLKGRLPWHLQPAETYVGLISYRLKVVGGSRPVFSLTYRAGRHPVSLDISLVVRPNHPGGGRIWFLCPLKTRDGPCRRRCGKLYLPPDAQYPGCRDCYDLTYQSCQESHEWDAWAAAMAKRFGPMVSKRDALDQIAQLSDLEREGMSQSFTKARKRRKKA
jgi:hypothetical protein